MVPLLFQHTLPLVLTGKKSQTRRLVGASDAARYADDGSIAAVIVGGRQKWTVGKTYAVQPARGKPQVARIEVTELRREIVAHISDADALAEGFASRDAFLDTWQSIHGASAHDREAWVITFRLISPEDAS